MVDIDAFRPGEPGGDDGWLARSARLPQNDIGNAGSSVAFEADTGGVHHTYLFTQGSADGGDNALDVLIDLIGVDAARLSATTAGTTPATTLLIT